MATLVTGGAGLVGSHVTQLLLERGDDVRVVVREATRRDNLGALDVATVSADLLDRAALRRALKGVERVFHAAGLTNLRASAETLYRANVETTRIVRASGRVFDADDHRATAASAMTATTATKPTTAAMRLPTTSRCRGPIRSSSTEWQPAHVFS